METRYCSKKKDSTDFRFDESAFKPIKWADLKEGWEVFEKGTILGEFRAYGPHTVEDLKRRHLKNEARTIFTHYPDDLLVRTKSPLPLTMDDFVSEGLKALDKFEENGSREDFRTWLGEFGGIFEKGEEND